MAKNYDYVADVERDEETHGAEVASSEKLAALAKARREVDGDFTRHPLVFSFNPPFTQLQRPYIDSVHPKFSPLGIALMRHSFYCTS